MLSNVQIINMTKDITVSILTNCDKPAYKDSGNACAEFMEAIYSKLVDLNTREDSNQLPR